MIFDILCLRSNLFLTEFIIYQPQILGNLGQYLYTLAQYVSKSAIVHLNEP